MALYEPPQPDRDCVAYTLCGLRPSLVARLCGITEDDVATILAKYGGQAPDTCMRTYVLRPDARRVLALPNCIPDRQIIADACFINVCLNHWDRR